MPKIVCAQAVVTDFSALLSPSPQAVAFSRLQNLSDTQFMRYAFFFSGLDEDTVAPFLARYEILAQNLAAYLRENGVSANSSPLSAAQKEATAEAILEYLFTGLLKRYSLTQTRLDTLFDSGVYNCVSSAIVYYALCVRNGIAVRGVKTRDHAFCAVTIGGKSIDVETTNSHGFNPGDKKEFSNAFGQTGFVYVPPANYRGRTDIGAKELLCLVLQNRIAELQKKRDFAASVRLAVDYYAALQTSESLEQLFSECANYAAALDMRRKHENALDFLSAAAVRYGEGKLLADTADKVYYNLFVTCFEKRGAVTVQKQLEQADGLYAAHKLNPLVSAKTKRDVLLLLYNQRAQELFTQQSWLELLALLAEAKSETANDSRAARLESVTLHNIGILYHNKFASLFNKGDKEGALAVLLDGLALVPDNKTLLQDYAKVQK